jgi:alpha-mannosidase
VPIRHTEYTRERLAQTAQRLQVAIYPETVAPDELLVAGPVDRIGYQDAARLDYRPAVLGERLGPLWATYWFRVAATVPEAWRGRPVDLLWLTQAESTL